MGVALAASHLVYCCARIDGRALQDFGLRRDCAHLGELDAQLSHGGTIQRSEGTRGATLITSYHMAQAPLAPHHTTRDTVAEYGSDPLSIPTIATSQQSTSTAGHATPCWITTHLSASPTLSEWQPHLSASPTLSGLQPHLRAHRLHQLVECVVLASSRFECIFHPEEFRLCLMQLPATIGMKPVKGADGSGAGRWTGR